MTMILIMILLAIVITTAILWYTEHYEAVGAIIVIVGALFLTVAILGALVLVVVGLIYSVGGVA